VHDQNCIRGKSKAPSLEGGGEFVLKIKKRGEPQASGSWTGWRALPGPEDHRENRGGVSDRRRGWGTDALEVLVPEIVQKWGFSRSATHARNFAHGRN